MMNKLIKDLKKIRADISSEQLIAEIKLEYDKAIDFAIVHKIIDSFIDKYSV